MQDKRTIKVIFQFDSPLTIEMESSKAFEFIDSFYGRSTTKRIQNQNAESSTKVPSRNELEDFIKSQPEYKFSVESISHHFIGDKISNVDEIESVKCLNAIRSKINRIRISIEESESGEWISEFKGRQKVFKFKKNVEIEEGFVTKDLEGEHQINENLNKNYTH